MLSERLNHTYRDLISIFFFLDSLFIILVAVWFFGFDGNPLVGIIIALMGTGALWELIYLRFKSVKNALKKRRYKIINLEHQLNYPYSFLKKIPHPSFGMGWVYPVDKCKIPKKYIGFEEGHRAYPIKEIHDIHHINLYKVHAMHPKYGALIEDVNHQKYLIDVRNLEMIS